MIYDFWERYRFWITALLIVAAAAASLVLYWREDLGEAHSSQAVLNEVDWKAKQRTLPLAASENRYGMAAEQEVRKSPDNSPSPMYADVKGRVKHPGVYTFLPNERVKDLLAKAGGPLADADLNQVNLAQPLSDGMVIWVPPRQGPANALSSAGTVWQPPFASSGGEAKINLNTADKEKLMTLPGVGETRAEAILQYRREHGPFRSVSDLRKIQGFGPKTLERLKERITVQ